MEMLLGIDVGTTATKAILIDEEGKPIASASSTNKLIKSKEDWVEQDPEDLWKAVVSTINEVKEELHFHHRIKAISISSQGGTTIPVDKHLKPTYNAISWMDNRARRISERLRSSVWKDRVYEITGWDLYDGLPILHICWLRQNLPDVYNKSRYFLFVNDFIINRLTGKLCMDPSNAGITQLYNISKGDWDEEMLRLAGVNVDQLSPIKPSGYVVGNLIAVRETGLSEDVLVVNGAHDQYCAALGCGVLDPGDFMLSCGTAWVILGIMDKIVMDPEKRFSVSAHVVANRWGALKSLGAVGASLEWFLENCLDSYSDRSEAYDKINRLASSAPVGSGGLIFLPASGSYGHSARGAFLGLSISHTRGDMARSIMEGIAFDLKLAIDEMRSAGVRCDKLKMVGGAASSPIWPRIVSEITDVPVELPQISQSASYGAAILAGIGSGLFSDFETVRRLLETTQRRVSVDTSNKVKYAELFNIYKEALDQIRCSLLNLSKFS